MQRAWIVPREYAILLLITFTTMPQQMARTTVAGDILHQWTIQEYEQYTRKLSWFVLMGIVGSVLIILALWRGNFLFLVIIILFGIILFLQSEQRPPQIPFKITDIGIIIGSRLYAYDELENFYIIYQPPVVKSLYFETKAPYRPRIHIPLLDQNPLEIRESLLQFLPEDLEQEQEPLSERMARDLQIH